MIKISNLNKYFYRHKSNEIHVINDTTLEFPETGLVTILGESGSGKTTLMNVIGGLDDFQSGSITIDNLEINKYSARVMDRIRSEKVGYIFQNYLLLQGRTVYENLEILLNMYNLSLEEKNERIDYVLKAVGMLKYKKKNVNELSGGQQQRVAIARALIKSPSLILADEPTGNLDEKNTIQIMNVIKKISKTTLVILVSHEQNIATSYSDYIIKVEDGKVVQQDDVKEHISYKYEDDRNLYLKEYQYKKIEDENIDIEFYSNENKKVNLQIVYENGRFYIKSTSDVIYLYEESEVKLINEHKKVLNTEEELEESNFQLSPLKFVRTPSLSFKEKIRLALSNLSKLKKRTIFLGVPLFLLSILILFCIQSIENASYIDKQHIVYSDSHLYEVEVAIGDARINKDVKMFGIKHLLGDLMENVGEVDYELPASTEFLFYLPAFTQIAAKQYTISGFSVVSNERLTEDDLIYGRLPQNASEVVFEKWVLENLLMDSTISNFMNISSFINKEISVKNGKYNFTIVGVADTNENTVYMNKWAIFDFVPSELRKNGIKVISESEFEKYDNTKLNLEKDECITNLASDKFYNVIETKLNNDDNLKFKIKSRQGFGSCPFDIVISDECYDYLFKSIASSNDKLVIYCDNTGERNKLSNYIASIRDYYANGELLATEENGFYKPTDKKEVELLINLQSEYYAVINPYLEESKQNVSSRIVITITILLISAIVIFFSMKSYSVKNMYDIGVYRAIGINKRSIVFVYALQILIISLKTTFIGCLITFAITQFVASIPIIDAASIAISFDLFAYTTFGLLFFNVLIGILPVMMYLKLTPSRLLTKTDL